MVDYVKDNFLNGRCFADLDDLNAPAAHWLEQTANVRVHATTRQRPVDLFGQEQARLTPLSDVPRSRLMIRAPGCCRSQRASVSAVDLLKEHVSTRWGRGRNWPKDR